MRSIGQDEAVALFPDLVMAIKTNPAYGMAMEFHPTLDRQARIGGSGPGPQFNINAFSHAVFDWLGGEMSYLLWISHWANDVLSFYQVFEAARKGLGAADELAKTPGHLFDPAPTWDLDEAYSSAEQRANINTACGLISLLQLATWDGWLLAENRPDRIEFWEGNVFFYSADPARLNTAKSILAAFKCGDPA